jgi:hypothetical protein
VLEIHPNSEHNPFEKLPAINKILRIGNMKYLTVFIILISGGKLARK